MEIKNDHGQVRIYPNPFRDELQVENSNYEIIEIFDIRGRSVLLKILDKYVVSSINTSAIDEGMYIVNLRGRNSVSKNLMLIKN